MKIQQIALNNIGPYIDKNIITFDTGDQAKNIVLIGGRNGAGKTTLFDAMRICLYGYKLYGYRQSSQAYTAKIKKLINDNIKRTTEPKLKMRSYTILRPCFQKIIFLTEYISAKILK